MIASISRRIRYWLTGQVPGEAVSIPPVNSLQPSVSVQRAVSVQPAVSLQRAVLTAPVATPHPTPAAKAATQTRRKPAPPKREVPEPAPRKGRSTEDTLPRTVELLSSNSQVTAGEVAKSLGVSASYARSLLRRARTRVTEQQKAQVPATTPTVIKAASSTATASSVSTAASATAATKSSNEDALTGILSRLSAAETELSQLRTRPAAKDMRWDLTTRSEVLRRHSAGETMQVIAAALGIPQGQVRFILDVNQILLTR